jgi:nitrite reductase/ring-hydroxylating ferredoxin subunit
MFLSMVAARPSAANFLNAAGIAQPAMGVSMKREPRQTVSRGVSEPLRPGASDVATAPERRRVGWFERLRLTEMLLGSVILLIAVMFGVGTTLFFLPPEHLQIPELQTAVQVVKKVNFPVGGSRTVTWGPRTILVVRVDQDRYVALQGISPGDGCLLRWDRASQRIVSPCRNAEFDLNGRAVRGLTAEPLQRYVVYLRGPYVYVTS